MNNSLFWDKEREGRAQVVEAAIDLINSKERQDFLMHTLAYASNMSSWYADRQHDNAELYRYLGQINAAIEHLGLLQIELAAQALQAPVWTLE